jgi:PUA domain protein
MGRKVFQISKKRFKEILVSMSQMGVSCKVSRSKNIKSILIKGSEVILVDERPIIVFKNGYYIPYIGSLDVFEGIKRVVVDKGAVRFITNGADVMRPGIVNYDEGNVGDVVVVFVEKYYTPLAVGILLVDTRELPMIERGKVVKNLHHIGDPIWKYFQELDRKD